LFPSASCSRRLYSLTSFSSSSTLCFIRLPGVYVSIVAVGSCRWPQLTVCALRNSILYPLLLAAVGYQRPIFFGHCESSRPE